MLRLVYSEKCTQLIQLVYRHSLRYLETNNSNTVCFTSDADYFSVLYLSL